MAFQQIKIYYHFMQGNNSVFDLITYQRPYPNQINLYRTNFRNSNTKTKTLVSINSKRKAKLGV